MASVSTLLFTYNCAQTLQPVTSIRSALSSAIVASPLSSAPSLIFLSLQEIAPIHDIFYFEKLQNYLKPFIEAASSLDAASYKLASSINSGLTAGVLFVKTASEGEQQVNLTDIRTSAVSFGALSMGLKGAAAIRACISTESSILDSSSSATTIPSVPVSANKLPPAPPAKFKGVDVTFVAAHFAANEGMKEKRDKNFIDTARKLAFFPPVNPGDEYVVASVVDEQRDRDFLYKDDTHVFICGDLNYRVQVPSSSAETTTVPAPKSAPKWVLPEDGDFVKSWFPHDELSSSIAEQTAFWGFKEAPVTFNPTYKYSGSGSDRTYNASRVPSWCDRILYLSVYDKKNVTIEKYDVLSSVPGSDHYPVYALATVPIDAAPGSLPSSLVETLAAKTIAASTVSETQEEVDEEENEELEAKTPEAVALVAEKNKKMKATYAIISDQVTVQNDHLHSRKYGRIRRMESYFGLAIYLLFTRAGNLTLLSTIIGFIAAYLYLYSVLTAFVEKNKDTSILALIFGADRVRPRRRRGQPLPTAA
ncbi:Endonuclease/exonuclease/phosphatase [Kockiozyma suomiensis]|uniref:Endonuclease/exonuclease/phosphatase n=1 Tax=Kockiozyma suomiensis TaxID=1337062 RepID=UPI0033433433